MLCKIKKKIGLWLCPLLCLLAFKGLIFLADSFPLTFIVATKYKKYFIFGGASISLFPPLHLSDLK